MVWGRFLWAAAFMVGSGIPAAGVESGAWAERAQIVYDASTRSVARRQVRVWDPAPEKNLDFVWEPDADTASIGDHDVVSGRGSLIWRVRGSASYDPKTIFSRYSGDMRDGRPHGRGRMEIRTGEILDGEWRQGRLHGPGMRLDAEGDRYEGEFREGKLHGTGRHLSRTGEIFAGSFVDGQRHGEGRVTLPGGTNYAATWILGREQGGLRPDALADATVGGLLRAQAGGGDAGKVEIGVAIDQRITQQSDMPYQHLAREADIAIFPVRQEMNDAWNGAGEITAGDYAFTSLDWENAPAFVEVDLETTDGSRVKIEQLGLNVAVSEAYRKPMLSLSQHAGCVGFRPSFSILNHGWGDVRDLKVNIQFTGETPEAPRSRVFATSAGGFTVGADVAIDGVLQEAGVNTAKLASDRFTCQSMDSLNVCRSQVFNNVGFGEVAEHVWGEDKLFTTAVGTFDYAWADDAGTVYQASEPFRVDIALATIEVPKELAECGDGFGGAPEALRYQDVRLPVNQRDYVVDMPVRGNKNISSYTARLKMSAEMSSFHQFTVAARFADGSERRSKPVSLFYYRPRPSTFETALQPPVCTLPADLFGC